MMYLTSSCMPLRWPIDRSILMLVCDSQWPGNTWIWLTFAALSWLAWAAQKFVGMPVDIFEDYRKMGETEGVGK